MRERLKEVLRQYELRERHFECVIRSKELEVLLSRARAAEQKQLAANEKARADKAEDEVSRPSSPFSPFPPDYADAPVSARKGEPRGAAERAGGADRQAHPVL